MWNQLPSDFFICLCQSVRKTFPPVCVSVTLVSYTCVRINLNPKLPPHPLLPVGVSISL